MENIFTVYNIFDSYLFQFFQVKRENSEALIQRVKQIQPGEFLGGVLEKIGKYFEKIGNDLKKWNPCWYVDDLLLIFFLISHVGKYLNCFTIYLTHTFSNFF